jgi:hypothetical protein
MTLGLPDHLIEPTMSRALARAANALGQVCLLGAIVGVIAISSVTPNGRLWITLLALVPMAILLAVATRYRTTPLIIAYLLVGAACTYIYTVTLLSDPDQYPATDMFVIALPVVAFVMVGVASPVSIVGVVWSTVALVLGEGAVLLAGVSAGVPYRLDLFAPAVWLLIVVVLVAAVVNRGRQRAAQPLIHQASRRDAAIMMRRDYESRATALVHDTALSHLVAISAATPGPLDPRLRTMISRDLERLIGQDWLIIHESAVDAEASSASWQSTPLADVVRQMQSEGLTVAVTGERTALARLAPARAEALALATRQCLVNVLRHAGVAEAEVSVTAGENEVTVMVTDAGDGFDPAHGTDSRLGLRHSVRGRIEGVGGVVHIWSSPGAGTTILLSVPFGSGAAFSSPSSQADVSDRAEDPA